MNIKVTSAYVPELQVFLLTDEGHFSIEDAIVAATICWSYEKNNIEIIRNNKSSLYSFPSDAIVININSEADVNACRHKLIRKILKTWDDFSPVDSDSEKVICKKVFDYKNMDNELGLENCFSCICATNGMTNLECNTLFETVITSILPILKQYVISQLAELI